MATDVWVLCEHAGGRLRKIAHELLGKARELAGRLGGRAAAVALGEGSGALAEEAGTHGADVLYALDSPALSSYTTDSYVAALAPLLQRERPFLLLVGSTALGRDLAPRLAARLRAGIVTDCTSVELQEGRVVVTRPVMTRKAIARVAFRGEGPKIAVVLPNVLQPAPPVPGARAEVVAVPVDAAPSRTRLVGIEAVARETVSLTEADVIVSGGSTSRCWRSWRPSSAAPWAPAGLRWTRGGSPTTTRSGRRARPSIPSSTSHAASRGPPSTSRACPGRATSWPSTRTPRPRSSGSPPTASWGTCLRSCRSSSTRCGA